MVDARKPLQVLHEEWSSCQACDLGKRRLTVGGAFVAGEGVPGGVLFVGEGPGRTEEDVGRPFVGASGQLLRAALEKLNFTNYYITNCVTCRACETIIDPATGTPRIRKGKYGRPDEIMYRDVVPKPLELEACQARLQEEIYIVDPVVIVTLGQTASEAVLGRSVAITKERGTTQECSIPGATMRALHTERRQVWGRKVQGQMRFPVEANEVRYLVIPTLHPAYILRKLGDRGPNSPISQFGADLRFAVKIYEKHMQEVLGREPIAHSEADLSNIGVADGEDDEG